MKICFKIFLILSHSFILSSGGTQSIHVNLDKLTTLDDIATHLTLLESNPKVKLQLPKVDVANAKFFDLFYTWDVESDPHIDVMVVQQKNYDELYIDINNDENLTNDGSPYVFKHDENSFSFDIVSNYDKDQKAKLILERKPELPDSVLSVFVDKEGNLNKGLAKQYGAMKGDFNYKGEQGTFYFDDRVSLRRGEMSLNDMSIQIGIFDFTNNGLFNDDEDVLIVDLDENGRLEYDNVAEVFKLNDIFTIRSQNYKIQDFDKYGKWVEIITTDEEATFYFLMENQNQTTKMASELSIKGELDQSFWELSFNALNDKKVNMIDFAGKYLLLNFWGEWCKPCIEEIPDLLKAKNLISNDKFEIISFAKSTRVDLLKKVITENNMDWPHIILPDEMNEKFKISGYPTNILILKNGRTYIRTGAVNYAFIASHIN